MTERTENDKLTEKPVTVQIAGLSIEVKPVKGIRWIQLTERLASLIPAEEVRKRMPAGGTLVFESSDIAELVVMLAGTRLTALFNLLLDAIDPTAEEREAIEAGAEPEEIIRAALEVAPVVFPLDRLAGAIEAMGLSDQSEAKAPVPANPRV